MKKKLFYIKTFGCQMNEYDSARLARLLEDLGYQATDAPENARIILVNTCSVRHKPEEKVYSFLGRMRQYKKENPEVIIGVGGCVAQQEGERIRDRAPYVDLIFGPRTLSHLPAMLGRLEAEGEGVTELAENRDAPTEYHPFPLPAPDSISAFVTIMEGCDNFCSFCIVPYVRGAETSRPTADIIAEVKAYLESGVKEIVLLGQNVNSYGRKEGKGGFADLLSRLNELPGLERLRFTTSHPKDLSDDLIARFGTLRTLCEHIHLPVQAGSNRVLERMNRRYRREVYLELCRKLRAAAPGMAISTDLIVGFPGETEADFRETLDLMQQVEFDTSFSFKYSPRPGTKAARFDDDVPETAKEERLKELQTLQRRITWERHRAMEGKIEAVLTEGPSRKERPGQMTGRTRTNRIINFLGPTELRGHTVSIRIKEGFVNSLSGEVV